MTLFVVAAAAATATACYCQVSEVRGLKRSTGNGLDMFGLTHAVVSMLIQVGGRQVGGGERLGPWGWHHG
jgi:hypothetical protein